MYIVAVLTELGEFVEDERAGEFVITTHIQCRLFHNNIGKTIGFNAFAFSLVNMRGL